MKASSRTILLIAVILSVFALAGCATTPKTETQTPVAQEPPAVSEQAPAPAETPAVTETAPAQEPAPETAAQPEADESVVAEITAVIPEEGVYTYDIEVAGYTTTIKIDGKQAVISYPSFVTQAEFADAAYAALTVYPDWFAGVYYTFTEPGEVVLTLPVELAKDDLDYGIAVLQAGLGYYIDRLTTIWALEDRASEVIAQTSVKLDASFAGKNSLAALVLSGMTDKSGADFALLSTSEIQAPIQKGDITVADVVNALPTFDGIVVQTVTGEQVYALLEQGYGTGEVTDLLVVYNPSAEQGKRVLAVYLDGQKIARDETAWTMVTVSAQAFGLNNITTLVVDYLEGLGK